jgi:hypothetical protein
MWAASLGKILTLDNLCKRHIIIIDWWCMCKKTGKPMITSFFIVILDDSWNLVFKMFGIGWVMPRPVVELMAC